MFLRSLVVLLFILSSWSHGGCPFPVQKTHPLAHIKSSITILNYTDNPYDPKLTDIDLIQFFKRCTSLQSVTLTHCTQITSHAIDFLLKKCKLQELTIIGLSLLSSAYLLELRELNPNLMVKRHQYHSQHLKRYKQFGKVSNERNSL